MSWLIGNPKALLIAIAIALTVGMFSGYKITSWRYDAELSEQLKAEAKLTKKYQEQVKAAAKALQEKSAETEIIYRTIKEKVYVTTTNSVCFGTDAVRVWNAAIEAVSPETTRTSEKTSRSDPSQGATDREVLENHVENAKLWKEQRDQLNAIIDFVENK